MKAAQYYSQQATNKPCLFRGKAHGILPKGLLFLFIVLFPVTHGIAQYKWTKQNSGSTEPLASIIWANNQFVAVSIDSLILTSPDGITWTRHNVNAELYSIAWTGDKYVAVGDTVALSSDGVTWTYGNLPSLLWGKHMCTVIWDGKQVVGAGSYVFRSFDGITWDVVFTLPNKENCYDLLWTGNTYIGLFAYTYTSPDLISWNQVPSQNTPFGLQCFTWDGKRIVGIGEGNVYESTDANQWTKIDTLPNSDKDRTLAGSLRFFNNTYIYCPCNWYIFISQNGDPWKKIYLDDGAGIKDVAFHENLFVAVGCRGSIYTSPREVGINQNHPFKEYSDEIRLRTIGNQLYLMAPALLKHKSISVKIYDLSGKHIFSHGSFADKSHLACNLGNLASGSYSVSIKSNGMTYMKKINFMR